MKTILSIPEEFYSYLKLFKTCYTSPQYQNFCRYMTGLVACQNKTIDHMNNQFISTVNQSTLNRFLTESPWSEDKVSSRYMKNIRSRAKDQFKTLIIDDTLSHKYGEKMQGVGMHYDHLTDSHTLGHSIFTSMLHTNKVAMPLIPRVYIREEDCKKEEFESKIIMSLNAIEQAYKLFKINLVITDAWYTCDQITHLCKSLGLPFIGAIKSNRKCSIDRKKKISVADYKDGLAEEDYKPILLNNKMFRANQKIVHMKGIGRVKLIISQMWLSEEKKWSKSNYIISTKSEWSFNTILTHYLKRWSIEIFHRESKQHLGLESYQMRSLKGITRHLILIALAYAMLVFFALDNLKKVSIGNCCRNIVNRIYNILLRWLLNFVGGIEHFNLLINVFDIEY